MKKTAIGPTTKQKTTCQTRGGELKYEHNARKGYSCSVRGKASVHAKRKNEDPIIAAIKKNNTLFDQRPVIDFSRIKYDI